VLAAGSAAEGAGAGPAHRIAGIVPPRNKVISTARAARASCHGPSLCTNLTYHDRPVMHTSTTYAIFWQPPGYTSFDGQPVYDTNYKSLIGQYFQDLQADSGFLSNVYGPNVQYCDGAVSGAEDCNGVPAGNHITTNTTYGGSWTDTQNFPTSGCTDPLSLTTVCLTDAQLITEIQHAISVNGCPRAPRTCSSSSRRGACRAVWTSSVHTTSSAPTTRTSAQEVSVDLREHAVPEVLDQP
jgi:hypothetical protein